MSASTLPIVSATLGAKLAQSVEAIKAGKHGNLTASITVTGAEASLGYRVREGWTVGAWAGKAWRGGFDGGVRTTLDW